MKLGILVGMDEHDIGDEFRKLRDMGFGSCQVGCWTSSLFTAERAEHVRKRMAEYAIDVSAFWCGWEGPCEWNQTYGPATIGLVPAAYRSARLDTLKKCSDFIRGIGITDIITHVGFIPADPGHPDYTGLIGALRELARHCGRNSQNFLFETGQETPVTLLRAIEDIGSGNVGINLDPANLLMYGMGNPLDALDVFGGYVRNVHAKDGVCPKDGRSLGEETLLGEGKVNYPEFIRKLKALKYDGYITIEREIGGERQIKDILAAKELIERLWNG